MMLSSATLVEGNKEESRMAVTGTVIIMALYSKFCLSFGRFAVS